MVVRLKKILRQVRMCWHAKMLVINFLVKKKKHKVVYYSPTSVKKNTFMHMCVNRKILLMFG